MRRLSRLCVVVVVLTLSLFPALTPTQAWADCAWILWQEQRRVGTSWQERPFVFEQAYATRESCEQSRAAANAIAGSDNDAKAAGRLPDDGIRRVYQCVPDTIDPRGPKGK
jgi:hypothetical protein